MGGARGVYVPYSDVAIILESHSYYGTPILEHADESKQSFVIMVYDECKRNKFDLYTELAD